MSGNSILPAHGLVGKSRCFLLVWFALLLPAVGISQTPLSPEPVTLELSATLERELAGGQKHSFQIVMPANHYVRIEVEQRGLDVVARRLGTDGGVVTEYDSDPRNNGAEVLELTGENEGLYRLTLEPRQRSAPWGRYVIRVLELRPATEKDLALDEARRLITEVIRLWRAGDYDRALPLAEQALAIRERELGADHADVGHAVSILANVYSDKPDYEKAEMLYRRAVEIRERALGKDHFSLSLILNNWGVLHKDRGDYVKADEFFRRVLEIREKSLEPDHLLIASVLNNLAMVANSRGDTEKAVTLYQRALEIRERALGPESPDVATALNNIANLQADPVKAERLYARALAIREKVLPPDHPDIAQTLYNLARLYARQNEYARARPLGERSLSIFEKKLGPDHPFVSYPMNLLGGVYKKLGQYEKAETLYQRAIGIKEKTQGLFHPHLGLAIVNLANLYAAQGEIDKALAAQDRANGILEYNIALNLVSGSEKEKVNYLRTLRAIENQTLTLSFQTAPESAEAGRLAATTTLQRKGRVLDAMSDSFNALRRRFTPEDQLLLDQLNGVTSRLVGLVLEGPGRTAAEEYRNTIRALEEERENLESRISRQSAGFFQHSRLVTLGAVQERIPKRAALVEFAVYYPVPSGMLEFNVGDPLDRAEVGSPRYVVYVIKSHGKVERRDLGEAQKIDDAIEALRLALRDPKRKDVEKLSRAVDEQVMRPVRAMLGDAGHLLVSPDGELNLVPFEALLDEKGNYLVENYSFTYLTSGRDLLRLEAPRRSRSRPLVIANPAFGEPEADGRTATARQKARRAKHASITAARDLSGVYFAELAGTAQEARAIQAIFPEATFLTAEKATESALKQTESPHILHIATHGFFLHNETAGGEKNSQPRSGGVTNAAGIENPLLRSGLALAGANRRTEGGDDGILTAFEAAGLNLWGTKLVVLSACDTGVGEIRVGEGVYGLRRAFVLAGTESLVMSLWPVSDYVTRETMTGYYRNLKQGMGRGEALRQVQLEMLKRPARRHPFYWASFIQSGEWADLQGRR